MNRTYKKPKVTRTKLPFVNLFQNEQINLMSDFISCNCSPDGRGCCSQQGACCGA